MQPSQDEDINAGYNDNYATDNEMGGADPSGGSGGGIACNACTFLNEPGSMKCLICETDLWEEPHSKNINKLIN